MKKFKVKNSKLIKRIGITIVIPIFLAIGGSLIFLSGAWNLVAQSYAIGSSLFVKPEVNLEEASFNINEQDVYRPDLGTEFATLKIDSVGIERQVIHGDGDLELKKGVGHYAGSTLPGENGNVVLSAHRDTAFRPLKDIEVGDEIVVETDYGVYKYKVKSTRITKPTDGTVTKPTDYEKLTLYTCYPFYYIGNAPDRFIVECEYIGVFDK